MTRSTGVARLSSPARRGRIGLAQIGQQTLSVFRNEHLSHFGMGTWLTPIRRPTEARRTLKTRLARPDSGNRLWIRRSKVRIFLASPEASPESRQLAPRLASPLHAALIPFVTEEGNA
jgi:hypothetical protein